MSDDQKGGAGEWGQQALKLTHELAGAFKTFKDTVERSIGTLGERLERNEKASKDLEEALTKAPRSLTSTPEFDASYLELDSSRESFSRCMSAKPVGSTSVRAIVDDLQRANDELLIAGLIGSARDSVTPEQAMRASRAFAPFEAKRSKLVRALSTTVSGEGSDWVPVGWSAQLIEAIELERLVAKLFQEFSLPTETYRWPFAKALPRAQRVAQATAATAMTFSGVVEIFGSGDPSANALFEPAKLRAVAVPSREAADGTIFPLLPWLRQQVVKAIANGWDDAVLNSDTSTSAHIDDDITEPPTGTTPETTIDGLRKFYLQQMTPAVVDVSSTPTLADYRNVRRKMGKYAARAAQLRWLVSMTGYIHMMSTKQVITPDKYLNDATILSGEIGRFDGTPVVLAAGMRDTLSASGKYTTAGPNDKTASLLVNPDNFLWGTRPGRGVESERLLLSDQELIVLFDRRAFQYVGTGGASGDKVVGALHGIPADVTIQ